MLIRHCKTTTTQETILCGEAIAKTRVQIADLLSEYTQDRIYRDLHFNSDRILYQMESKSFQLPMKRSFTGLYMVPVTIAGEKYRFVLDSGAQISGVRQEILEKINAERMGSGLSIGSIGGTKKMLTAYILEDIQIGSLTLYQFPVITLHPPRISPMNSGFYLFDGIIGWDILSQLDFEIDDVAKVWKVLENRYSFAHPNMVRAIFPILLVKDAKGNLLKMGLDTGARCGWVNKEKMELLGYELSQDVEMYGYGVHGIENMNIQLIKEMDFYLYKAHIHLRYMHTGDTNIFATMPLDGILGNEIFRNRRIRFINSKEMVLLV
ncbi:hypothetical protein D5266_04300 [bacterium c-19]|nr:hypothetical protein [bacterium c-19]